MARDWLRRAIGWGARLAGKDWERLRKTGKDWEARQQDDGTAERRDYETTGRRDCETTGRRDDGTTGRRDYGTAEKPSRSQAFPGILSRAWLCEATCRQSGADVVPSRSLTGWGCTWAYIPIQADEGSAADDPLSQKLLGVRRAPSATLGKNAVDG